MEDIETANEDVADPYIVMTFSLIEADRRRGEIIQGVEDEMEKHSFTRIGSGAGFGEMDLEFEGEITSETDDTVTKLAAALTVVWNINIRGRVYRPRIKGTA